MVLAPPESPRYLQSHHTLLPPDTYWGVHPFVVPPLTHLFGNTGTQGGSGLTQWYATSNSSFTDLRELPLDRSDIDAAAAEWPILSSHDGRMMSPISPDNVRESSLCMSWNEFPTYWRMFCTLSNSSSSSSRLFGEKKKTSQDCIGLAA